MTGKGFSCGIEASRLNSSVNLTSELRSRNIRRNPDASTSSTTRAFSSTQHHVPCRVRRRVRGTQIIFFSRSIPERGHTSLTPSTDGIKHPNSSWQETFVGQAAPQPNSREPAKFMCVNCPIRSTKHTPTIRPSHRL